MERQFKTATAQLNPCLPAAFLKQAHPELASCLRDVKSSAIFAEIPGRDSKKSIEYLVSFNMIRFCLDFLCESRELTEDTDVNQLYKPLYDSADSERILNYNDDFYFNKPLGEYVKRHVEKCWIYLETLPGYGLVRGKIKKYIQLYIGLQACKYQPLKLRMDKIGAWSNYYIRQFPGITLQEFCTFTDSLLGVQAMLSAAASPDLDEDTVIGLDHAYSPWICSLHKMFQYYTTARDDVMMGRMNFADFYCTLKRCEERLIYLMKKSLESISGLGSMEYHRALVIILAAVYLSDSRANFGLNKLASCKILDSAPLETRFLLNICKLVKVTRGTR